MSATTSLPTQLEKIVQSFEACEKDNRLQLLLSYTDKALALPEDLAAHGLFKDESCQTPFFIAAKFENENPQFYFDAPKDALMYWAFAGILTEGLAGTSLAEVLAIANDFYYPMALDTVMAPMQAHTLGVMFMKYKLELQKLESGIDSGIDSDIDLGIESTQSS